MTLSSKFLLSMLLFSSSTSYSEVRTTHREWVISHLDKDDCVPLTHISGQGNHIYTQGPFRTPADIMNWIGLPYQLVREEQPELADRLVDFLVHSRSGEEYHMMFFDDQDFCRATFGNMKK